MDRSVRNKARQSSSLVALNTFESYDDGKYVVERSYDEDSSSSIEKGARFHTNIVKRISYIRVTVTC